MRDIPRPDRDSGLHRDPSHPVGADGIVCPTAVASSPDHRVGPAVTRVTTNHLRSANNLRCGPVVIARSFARPPTTPCTPTDYGIIILPRSFVRPTRLMPLQARAAERSSILVTIAGFPGDKNNVTPGSMWRHSEGIGTVATTDGLLRHPHRSAARK